MLRCTINKFGYCSKPIPWNIQRSVPTMTIDHGVHILNVPSTPQCHLNPRDCGFFVSWKEECRRLLPVQEER